MVTYLKVLPIDQNIDFYITDTYKNVFKDKVIFKYY